MKDQNILEEISALLDNEIKNPEREKELSNLIRDDKNLEIEFNVQSEMKTLLNKRFADSSAPSHIREQIISKINSPEPSKQKSRKNILQKISEFIIRPTLAIPAVVIILLGVLIFSSGGDSTDVHQLLDSQIGQSNIFAHAKSTFEKIRSGDQLLQIQSSDPKIVKQFYADKGVIYNAEIPTCECWTLAGGFVTECNGEKIANGIYKNEDGKILYMFHACENFMVTKNLSLSADLLECLQNGDIITCQEEDCSVVLSKSGTNVFVCISDETIEYLADNVIKYFKDAKNS